MSDDIVAFIRARLDEDHDEATEAAIGESFGRLKTGPDWVACSGSVEDAVTGGTIVCDEGMPTSSQARHIARHDPARVLREVEAKRLLLDEHAPRQVMDMRGDGYGYPTICCGMCSPTDPNHRQRYPCRTVRLLAAPYADHPDYRQEWTP